MKKILLICVLTTMVVGCAGRKPMPRPAFPVATYEALKQMGTGVLKGQAFLKTIGGDVKFGAGEEVQLYPVTDYSFFWYKNAYIAGKNIANADPRYSKYVMSTITDAQGNFTFTHIPAGEYYVVTSIVWEIPFSRYLNQQTGGLVAKRVEISDDIITNVILTR